MGYRTELFKKYVESQEIKNIEIISFLAKNELNDLYKECSLLVLPSRQECWGLVINEASSFGTPIVSTYGSGAAVEFLDNEYSNFLALPNNVESLYNKINLYLRMDEQYKEKYSKYLIEKSSLYTIEKSARVHENYLWRNYE